MLGGGLAGRGEFVKGMDYSRIKVVEVVFKSGRRITFKRVQGTSKVGRKDSMVQSIEETAIPGQGRQTRRGEV